MTKDVEVPSSSTLQTWSDCLRTQVPEYLVCNPGRNPSGTSAQWVDKPHNHPEKSLNCNVGCKVIKLWSHQRLSSRTAQPDDEAIRSRLSPVNMFRVLAAPVSGWMGR